jgi:hypothetical protein
MMNCNISYRRIYFYWHSFVINDIIRYINVHISKGVNYEKG